MFNSSATHRHGPGRHMTDSGGGGIGIFNPGPGGSTAESGRRSSPGSGPTKPSQRPTFDSSSPVGKILERIYTVLLEALIRLLPPEAEIQQRGISPELCRKLVKLIRWRGTTPVSGGAPRDPGRGLGDLAQALEARASRGSLARLRGRSRDSGPGLRTAGFAHRRGGSRDSGPDSEPQAPPKAGPGTEEAKREHLIGILRELGIKGASLASTWKTETLERKAAEALKAQRTPANDEA